MQDSNQLTEEQIYNLPPEQFDDYVNDMINNSVPIIQQREMNRANQAQQDTEPQDEPLDNEPDLDDNSINDDTEGLSSKDDDDITDNNPPINQPDDDDNNTPLEDDQNKQQPSNSQQKYKVKANGQYFEFTTDELVKLAPKALGFTKKLQQIAPFRRTISAMEENGITEDDVNHFIEMKKGNKEAIANFLSNNNISPYDLNMADENLNNYRPQKYGQEQSVLKDVIEEAEESPKFSDLQKYVSTLDDTSRKMFIDNPDIIKGLINDMERGIFDNIAPEANKRAIFDTRTPRLQHYINIANEQAQRMSQQATSKKKGVETQVRNDLRQKARVGGNRSVRQAPPKVIDMVEELDDKSYHAWLEEIGMGFDIKK